MNRQDFPIFKNRPNLVYLDNANTTMKPKSVIAAVTDYYTKYCANTGRTSYENSELATKNFATSRQAVAKLIGAKTNEINFTYSATYAINQVVHSLYKTIKSNDVILLTRHEHNSNLLPWINIVKNTGAKLCYIDDLSNPDLERLINKVKIFAYSAVSNLTGQSYDYSRISRQIRQAGGYVLVDVNQLVGHQTINIDKLGCDFLMFSAHKLYGPSGVGVLYAKKATTTKLSPLVYGSQTFQYLSDKNFTLVEGPQKFEPGTANIEGVIGLGKAIEYLSNIGLKNIALYELDLKQYLLEKAAHLDLDKYLVKNNGQHIALFNHPLIHPHDIANLLDSRYHIAVRAGKCCNDLNSAKMHLATGAVRVSWSFYNTKKDIAKFLSAYKEISELLKVNE